MPTYDQASQQFVLPKPALPRRILPPSENSPMQFGMTVDRSSSMTRLREIVLGGMNFLLAEQKPPTRFSFCSFANSVFFVHRDKPIDEVRFFSEADYEPYGGTALLDGIGDIIEQIARIYDPAPAIQKPRVLIAILTDGAENSSTRFKFDRIFHEIHYRRQGCRWEFLFLTSDLAGESYGLDLGIQKSNVVQFSTDPAAMKLILARLSKAVSAFRLGDKNYQRFLLTDRQS